MGQGTEADHNTITHSNQAAVSCSFVLARRRHQRTRVQRLHWLHKPSKDGGVLFIDFSALTNAIDVCKKTTKTC